VISTPVGGIKEIITDGQNGLLVQSRDFQQLYQAISGLIRNPALSASLGMAAVQTVQERYSAGIIVQKHRELFRRVHLECLAGSS
jgi:glycosyltransferase involved in cell wall biosynthesis